MVGISLDNFPCVDPKKIRDYCVSQGLSTSWYGKPNKYVRPLGAEPGYGHLLFQKSDYDALVRTGTTVYTLRMQSQYASAIFPGIMLAGFPRNLTPGAKDPVLMTEITDTTSNLLKATNTRYTWRDRPSSESPVNPKTWLTAAEDLWNKCQFAQAFPGLPSTVHGGTLDIEQFDCHGFRAISALEDLLQALGCVLAYDPTLNVISIQYIAGDQERIIEFATYYRDLLVHDETPYNPTPLFSVPTQARILFPVWSEYTDEDPRVMYAKDVSLDLSTGLTGATANGTVILQDKQPLRVDSSGAALNQTLIDNRAAAIAATYLDRIRTTTCQWPINRVYKGFIGGQQTPGLPGVMFDLVAWFDTGEGPMTAFLRQGIAGTGELYDTSSLPTAGIISSDHNPNMLVQGLGVVRANGIQPSQGRAKQNEGWWDDPTREVVRLVGTGLGPYMMRTQSLRYGEYAQVSTGGRGDLRGRLTRPWDDNSTSNTDKTRFCWVYGANEPDDALTRAAYLMKQSDLDPLVWTIEKSVYLRGANDEPLTFGLKYMAHEANVQYVGSVGTLDVYHTFCCDGTPSDPPLFALCGSTRFQMSRTLQVTFDTMGGVCTDSGFNNWYTKTHNLTYIGEFGVDAGMTCAYVLSLAKARYDAMYPGSGILTDSAGFLEPINSGLIPWCGYGLYRKVWMSSAPVDFPPRADGILAQILIAVTWGIDSDSECFMDVFNVGIHGPFGSGFYTGGGGIFCTRAPDGGARMAIHPENVDFISNIYQCIGSLVCSVAPSDYFRINIRNA